MSADAIGFLKQRHQNARPAQEGINREMEFSLAIRGLVERVSAIETQFKAIGDKMAAQDVLEYDREIVREGETRIQEIKAEVSRLDEILYKKQAELGNQNQEVANLIGRLQALRSLLRQTRDYPATRALYTLGGRIAERIGGTTSG